MLDRLRSIVESSRRIVFLGGAGMSTASGIADFRSADGVFVTATQRCRPEEILSRTFFDADPTTFFSFYRTSMVFPHALPNLAHCGLVALEHAGRLTAVVTQNIDGLHQRAGSSRVLELHGSVHRNICQDCGMKHPLDAVLSCADIPRCPCGGIIKPDVVLYEEALDRAVLTEAARAVESADALIVGGTSLVVYPAAGLLNYFSGRHLVVINLDPTDHDARATLVIRAPLEASLGQFVGSPPKPLRRSRNTPSTPRGPTPYASPTPGSARLEHG